MSNLQDKFAGFREFLGGVADETKKTTWPNKDELLESTVVVLVSVLLMGTFVALSDLIAVRLIKWLLGLA